MTIKDVLVKASARAGIPDGMVKTVLARTEKTKPDFGLVEVPDHAVEPLILALIPSIRDCIAEAALAGLRETEKEKP